MHCVVSHLTRAGVDDLAGLAVRVLHLVIPWPVGALRLLRWAPRDAQLLTSQRRDFRQLKDVQSKPRPLAHNAGSRTKGNKSPAPLAWPSRVLLSGSGSAGASTASGPDAVQPYASTYE